MNRRTFLKSAALTGAALGLPRPARASVSGADLKFIFVFNRGGWDPTRVFAAEFDNDNVDMEGAADRATAGELRYADHPDRPSVRAFFEDNHDRMVVFNGLQVRSIAHEICTMISLTGSSSGLLPDWPAILAADQSSRYVLPHLVLGGPSFAGDLSAVVARTGLYGQLDGLLSGDILYWSDANIPGLSPPAQSLVDRYLARRASARARVTRGALDASLSAALSDALGKASAMKDVRYVMAFDGGTTLAEQSAVAADALSMGVSRCVTLGYPSEYSGLGWDTHANNDDDQSPLWEGLFQGLAQLAATLDATPGEQGGTLAEETVVVVLSEMGRTPQLNGLNGKDHWPFTSALLFGAGLNGDRTVGEFDDSYYGRDVDPATGEVADGTQMLSAEALGATLLALGGIDPGPHVSGVEAIEGVIA